MGRENRLYERVETEYLVRVIVPAEDGASREGTCLNLSEGGLFIQTEDPPPRGTRIRMELYLQPLDRILRLDGIVVWTRPRMPDRQFPPGVGVSFAPLTEEERQLIRSTMEEQRRALSARDEGVVA